MNFVDERHALYVGWVLGLAWQHGIPAEPVVDDDGDYTDRLLVSVNECLDITIVIPEPPEGWTLQPPQGET